MTGVQSGIEERNNRCSLRLAFLLWILACWNLWAQPTDRPQSLPELEQEISRALKAGNVPAAGVALVTGDEIVRVAGLGKANVAEEQKAGPNTLFRVGSISKTLVSLAVLKLQEEGKLRLEDRLQDLAPEVPFSNPWEDTHPVRLVHLLEHTAGFDDLHLCEYAQNETVPLLDGLLYHPHSRTSRWPPGTHFSYCNSGPAVAAYVVEKITGLSFEDYASATLLRPMGMTTASFSLTESVEGILAKGYRSDGRTEVPYWNILMKPAGALNASPTEMAYLVQMLINRGKSGETQLLSPESIARMEMPTTTLAAEQGIQAGYGLGNFTTAHQGFLFHGHDGGIGAYLASYGYLPHQRVGYAFMLNSGSTETFDEIAKLLRDFLTKDWERPRTTVPDLPPERLTALTRYYRPIAPRQEISRFLVRLLGVIWVEADGPRLSVVPFLDDPKLLLPVTDRRFRSEEESLPSVVFLPAGEGELLVQGFSRALSGSYHSASVLAVWLERIFAVACLILMASTLLFALIWMPRWLLWGLPLPHLSVRVLPLLATVSFSVATGLVVASISSTDFFLRFGTVTFWSVSFLVLSVLFAVLAFCGLLQAFRSIRWDIDPNVRLHSILVALAVAAVALYLSYWGIIGLRSWA